MIFTTFISLPVTNKVPVSPNIDGSFEFINVEYDIYNCHKLFQNEFVLSRPLKQSVTTKRQGVHLDTLYDSCNYVILDIDKVTNLSNILKIFKNLGINCNVFKSRSYVSKSTIKAVIQTEFVATLELTKATLNYFANLLHDYCEIDPSSVRSTSYQAPTNIHEDSLLLIADKDTLKLHYVENFVDIIETEPLYNINMSLNFTFEYIQSKLGGSIKGPNSNSTYQVSLPTEKTPFGYFIHPNIPYLIQHPNKDKSFSILNEFIKTPDGRKSVINSIEDKFNKSFDVTADMTINERYCSAFELPNKQIAIKSPMGSGKSNFIEYMFDNGKTKTLLISVRKTLSYDFSQKYNIKNYLQHLQGDDKWTPGENFVCQIDSLWRVDLKYFDTVVIDEFESFLLYCSNHLVNNSNFVKIMHIIKNIFQNKRLIVMDAFINKFTLNKFFNEIYLIENTYRDEQKVFWYEQKETFFSIIEEYSQKKEKGETISMSFCTLKDMEICARILEKKGLKTFQVTSKTDDLSKEALFRLFKDESCDKYDVILFSPVITVGISILHNIKHHFHFDLGKSVDPISSIQMVKRSRKAEIIHIYCDGKLEPTKVTSIDLQELKSFVDIDTGSLSTLGEFVNKFREVRDFYTPSHCIAVKQLLLQQFNNIEHIQGKVNNKQYKCNKRLLKNNNSSFDRDYYDVTDSEDTEAQLIHTCMIKFNIEQSIAIDICRNGLKFVESLYNLYIVKYNLLDNEIKNVVSKSPGLMFINTSDNLKWLLLASDVKIKLSKEYSPKQVAHFDAKTKRYLKGLGYKQKQTGFYLDKDLMYYINMI